MAVSVINGVNGYITKVRGTSTSFIRETVINAVDLADFETAKSTGASVAGVQTVDFDGSVVAGSDAGLVTGTYTASINLDGTAYPVSVTVTTADTFTTVITAINADLPGTELGIAGGNLVVTSPTTGNASYVVITDVDLFSGMSGYAGALTPVDGGTGGALKAITLANGANAFTAYSPAQEVYNTAASRTIVKTAYTVADLNSVFADTEVEAELAAIKVKLDALQELV